MKIPDLIMAVFDDYAALKKKGKEGESVLHYDGFINGYELGYKEAVEKACEFMHLNVDGDFEILGATDELIKDFRKAMGVEHNKREHND